jgi:DnaJ like chaperone protein
VESLQPEPGKEKQPLTDSYAYSEELHHPITQEVACRLLGVLATSTRAQVKAAYRRRVSQFHPDRLGCMSEEERLAATERMAAINEAYRLLRTRIAD